MSVDAEGVAVGDRGTPVLYWRTAPAAGREAWRVDYLHPVHSIAGAVLTEDAPADHLHQRGIYWAWRRILVDGVQVADGWVGDRLELQVGTPRVRTTREGLVEVEVRTTWRAPVAGVVTPIVAEKAVIRVHPLRQGERRLDLEVRLRALRPGVQLAGTDDEKGYGGLSWRFGNAERLHFASDGRDVEPKVASVATGDALRLTWDWAGASPPDGWPAEVSLSCQVDGKPWRQWVLRRERSMQNCAFPGRVPHALPVAGDLRLTATTILH